jgi:hypothetical protein
MLPIIGTYATDRPHRAAALGHLAGGVEAHQAQPSDEQCPTRDRGRKADVLGSFVGRHRLVIAEGYYEWKTDGKHKQPCASR